MNESIILSHKNPDTDSIAASLVLENYLKNVLKSKAKAYRVGEINNETKFVLDQFKISAPPVLDSVSEDASIILVDHNNPEEAMDNLDLSKVKKIVDHHKLTLQTAEPIFCLIEPVGSTNTILSKLYRQAGEKITDKMAKLMVAGILSDTLNLTGPTTTEDDKKTVESLNKIAKIKTGEFTQKMFEAKSDITGLSAKDIVEKDYKLFEMGTNKIGIGAWETLKTDSILKIKEQIISELKNKKAAEKLDYIFFLLVDIMKQNSIMFIIGEPEKTLVEKLFGGKTENNEIFLKGIVSRKKQVVPPLMNELTK